VTFGQNDLQVRALELLDDADKLAAAGMNDQAKRFRETAARLEQESGCPLPPRESDYTS